MTDQPTEFVYNQDAVHRKFEKWLQLRNTPTQDSQSTASPSQTSTPKFFNATLMQTAGLHDPLCAFHLLKYLNIDAFGSNHRRGDGSEDGEGEGGEGCDILDEQQVEGWDYKATARRQREAWELKEKTMTPNNTPSSRSLQFTSSKQHP